ncbi:MAG: DnaJ domain-containing protein [Bdellovibrionaceae bacterium]|nr:DnaJ domain-containing protein [Pseudobdellovibrionaceae bacterium]
MSTQASFRQILEEKLQVQGRDRVDSAPMMDSLFTSTDPAHLAYLLGNLGVSYWQPQPQRIYPAGPRPTPRAHVFSPEQQLAYDFFNSSSVLGKILTPAFTRRDLKKAFRQLALRLHPDMNKGAVAPFLDLKNSYELLGALFTE